MPPPLETCEVRGFAREIKQTGGSVPAGVERRMQVPVDLIIQAQDRDAAAFNQIVLAYRKRVVGTIVRMIARPEDAEDIAQEVFTRLYLTFQSLKTPKSFEFWLHRITVNTAYSYLRRRRGWRESRISEISEREMVLADAAASTKVDRDDQCGREVREFVDELLGGIPEADRILLVLKEVDGLSLKDLEKVYRVR